MREYNKPVFTKKHYEVIVNFLAETVATRNLTEINLLEEFVGLFEEDNKRFKTTKFINKYWALKDKKIEELIKQYSKK